MTITDKNQEIHTYTYIYIYIHTNTHTCVCVSDYKSLVNIISHRNFDKNETLRLQLLRKIKGAP